MFEAVVSASFQEKQVLWEIVFLARVQFLTIVHWVFFLTLTSPGFRATRAQKRSPEVAGLGLADSELSLDGVRGWAPRCDLPFSDSPCVH